MILYCMRNIFISLIIYQKKKTITEASAIVYNGKVRYTYRTVENFKYARIVIENGSSQKAETHV